MSTPNMASVRGRVDMGPAVATKRKTGSLKTFESEAVDRYLGRLFRYVEDFKRQYYPTWFELLAMLQDEHYAHYVPEYGYWEPPKPFGEKTYRAVINFMLPAHQNLIAKSTKNRLATTVVPTTGDALNQDTVRFIKQLDDHLQHVLNRERVQHEILGWMYALGMGFGKSYWDPYGGAMEAATKDGKVDDDWAEQYPEFADAGLPTFKRAMTGEVRYESRSLMDMLFVPTVASIHDSYFMGEQAAVHMDELRERHPETWRKVNPSEANSSFGVNRFYKDQLRMNLGAGAENMMHGSPLGRNELKDFGTEIEWYFKPCKLWPKGALIHWTPDTKTEGDGVLNVQDIPTHYTDDRTGNRKFWCWHPYSVYQDIIVPGKPISRPTLQSAMHTQRMYNRGISSLQEFINKAAKYRVAIREHGAQIDEDAITDEHMSFIPVKGNPKDLLPMPVAQLSNIPEQMLDRLEGAQDKILSQTLDKEAQAVRSGLSGDAIEYLDALQSVVMVPKIRNIVDGMTTDSRNHVMLARKHYSEDEFSERFIAIAGDGGMHRVRRFDKALISPEFTFRVVGMSDVTRSQAARKNEILKYYNASAFGAVGSPEANRTMLKLSEFGLVDQVFEKEAVTDSLVHSRLDSILDKSQSPDDGPWPFEDHDASLEILNMFRRKYYGGLDKMQRQRVDYLAMMHQFLKGAGEMQDNEAASLMGQEQEMGGPPPQGGPGMEGGDEQAPPNEERMSAMDSPGPTAVSKFAKGVEGEQ